MQFTFLVQSVFVQVFKIGFYEEYNICIIHFVDRASVDRASITSYLLLFTHNVNLVLGVLKQACSSLVSLRDLLQVCYLSCVHAYKPGQQTWTVTVNSQPTWTCGFCNLIYNSILIVLLVLIFCGEIIQRSKQTVVGELKIKF